MFPERLLLFDSDADSAIDGGVDLHLHPHYREKLPLESTLLKRQASLDSFVTEEYSDEIERRLAALRDELLVSPQNVLSIQNAVAPTFRGCSLRPTESRVVRTGPVVEVIQNNFASQPSLEAEAFLHELRLLMASFSTIKTAEFQIVSIDDSGIREASSPENLSSRSTRVSGRLETRVRYELVGAGKSRPDQPVDDKPSAREQRVGHWDIEWEARAFPASPQTSLDSKTEFGILGWRALTETVSRSPGTVFVDVAGEAFSGVGSFTSQLLLGADHWRTILDGACGIDIYGHNGISVGDIDGDGFDDLYVCQPDGLPNRLYRNKGDGTFEDITEASGLGILENTACALFADYDNDGRQDLIVVRTDGPVLFHNEGGGKFRRVENAFKFAKPPQGTFTGAAVADYDRDGWLDVYFCLYLYYQGTEQYKYPSPYYDAENGPENFLMRNNRDGTFGDVTAEAGLDQNNTRYSFCCGWGDYHGSGWLDLYVVNDFGRKNLYRNHGDGTFSDVAPRAGVEDIGAGMGVCNVDYDNDGAEGIYVANMWTAAGNRISAQKSFQEDAPENIRSLYRKHAMGNSLFRNSGDGTFRDVSIAANLGMGRWSWSSDAWDFDHDGFADIYVTNGMISGPSRSEQDLNSFFWRQVVAKSPVDARPSREYEQGWNAINEMVRSDGSWSGFERNVFYANNRDGSFSDVSGAVGLDFIEDGRAFALADFDHDGRLEAFIKNRNSPQLRLAKNVNKELPPSIAFRLSGTGKSNRDAIGAAVTVKTKNGQQTLWLQAGSGFLSQHSKEVFFGLGNVKAPIQASIRWPSGTVQDVRDLPINCRVWVEEGSDRIRTDAFKAQVSDPRGNDLPQKDITTLPTEIDTWLIAPLPAPDFALPDLNGRSHALSSLQGGLVLLHFWTARSNSHQKDLTALNDLYKTPSTRGPDILAVNVDSDGQALRALAPFAEFSLPILCASDDVIGIYNLLFRQLFDRHRDMPLPTSLLLDAKGDIVKIYQGRINVEQIERDVVRIPKTGSERLARALPFPGVSDAVEFQRNYLSLGSVFYQRGYFDQAGRWFELALADEPASAESLYGLGSVYLKQEKTGEARKSFERATKARASYPETASNSWNNLGLLATREQHFDEAIRYFQEAVRLSPASLVALNNLGNAFRQQRRWDDARAVLARAIEVDPKDSEANYSLGMVFAQLNDPEKANEYLQTALQFRPAYPEALNNLGVLHLRSGAREKAVASFEECIRVAPGFDQAYLNLAKVYALENEPTKARLVLRELLRQHPGHAAAQVMLEQLGN
ncbi:MAG: FG-GAP-like repeat-containing protein [Acidobacteriaceae bacterium]